MVSSRRPSGLACREVADERAYQKFLAYYRQVAGQVDLRGWSIAQCHIAAANMMSAAASLGIDSCPIGGFDATAVLKAIAGDPKRFAVAMLLPLGYRRVAQPERQRLSLRELVIKQV